MSKAEERALEAYPDYDAGSAKVVQGFQRQLYINGYEQAEKDLALTWEDMKFIIEELDGNIECDDYCGSQKYYEEILKRFKEAKK